MRTIRHPHPYFLFVFFGVLLCSVAMPAATTIVATPSSFTLNYTKGGTLPISKVTIAPAGTTSSIYFTVNPATLPPWLQVDKTNGTAATSAPVVLTFSPSLVAANSPAGTYTNAVEVDSTGLTPIQINVTMIVTNAAPSITATLTVSPTNWTPGSTLPAGVLTVKSSGDPLYFTATATPSWITLSATSDVAYSWGTNIAVTFTPSIFDNPVVNSTLSGTVTVKAGTTTISNPVSITIGQPVATISAISPKQLPQVIPGSSVRTIAVQGTNFANGMTVKLGGATGPPVTYNCGTFTTGTTDAWCLQSSSQFFLRLSTATLAGAAATGNQIVLYLSAGASGQVVIPVVTTPIVYAVTDAASFAQPASGQFLNVAAYEMLSIFGDNLGTPAAPVSFTNNRLPNFLTDSSSNQLRVHFTDSTGNALVADSDAYILLWTPTQINVLAPSNLPPANGGQELKATVWVGGASSSSIQADATNTFNVVGASPALLTLGGVQAVAVNADNSINSSANPARFGSTVVLYLSGMGDPQGGSAFAGNSGPLVSGFAGCATPASFLAAATISHATWVSFDGAVVDSSILGQYALPPCFDPSTVAVKIGNVILSNVVAYAGFTADSIAGLYQMNVAIPLSSNASLSGLTPAAAAVSTAYPIQVSIGGAASQTGINIYLAK
ncbi:MAG TPA: hypothetical protein VKU19_14500 [Bryobacteraceae bacterium]|nr:hypothetical protein [Bryobacteraceae bacterium]